MIVWLASYPRSGNTMFRMMLHQVFGCSTYTRYSPVAWVPKGSGEIPKATGRAPLPAPWKECYGPMSNDNQVHFVKTHDAPEDDAKTIYIVRNGFAAIRSFKSFMRDFDGLEFTLEQIIIGEPKFGSWGWHLDVWDPLQRPNTLLLKYEDLVERPEQEIPKIAEFTGYKQQREWVNQFDKFHAEHPTMFRQGHRPNPESEFTEMQKQLFWGLHGDWMLKLGYCSQLPGNPATRRTMRQTVSERLRALRAPPPDTSQNGHADTERKYRRLKKHWWTRLGRAIRVVPKSRNGKAPLTQPPPEMAIQVDDGSGKE